MAQDGRRISANPQTTNGTGKKAKQNNMEGPSVSNGTASFVCFNGRCEMITRKNGKFRQKGCRHDATTPREEILEALIEELRSLQQLHEYEVGPEDAALAVSRARLNELVPIDNTEEAKETVTDSIIKKLEVYIENNGTVAPFLQSEKDDIRLEVLDEVGKLEEEKRRACFA